MKTLIPFLQGLTPFLQVALTGAIALLTVQIARQQVQITRQQGETNRSQLRLNLFDKRLEVFESAMKLIARVVSSHGKVTHEERIDFVQKTKAARFLFGPEAESYFDHLARELINIQVASHLVETLGEQPSEMFNARVMCFNEQLDQLPKEFDDFLIVESVPNSSKKRFSARFKYDPEQSKISL